MRGQLIFALVQKSSQLIIALGHLRNFGEKTF